MNDIILFVPKSKDRWFAERFGMPATSVPEDSYTIRSPRDELIITGPGKAQLKGRLSVSDNIEQEYRTIEAKITLYPVNTTLPITLLEKMKRARNEDDGTAKKWIP